MVWVVKLEKVIEGKVISRRKVMTLERPENIQSLEDLGLRLEDGKTLLAEIQSMLVDQQFEQDQEARTLRLLWKTTPYKRLSHASVRHALWPCLGKTCAV